MKRLPLILCLTLGVAVADAQKSLQTANVSRPNTSQGAQAQLQLSTSVIQQRYSLDMGTRLLRLTLNLTYSNIGNGPILLDKKSSLVYRKSVSQNPKAASERKYEYDERGLMIDSMEAAGMRRGAPERDAFIILKPGESYGLKEEIFLRLYDGTKDTEGFLHPGTHFLQVRAATWYYFRDPNEYQKKWADEGYVWYQNITSVPMPLKIEKTW
jgi:hypothetical protein